VIDLDRKRRTDRRSRASNPERTRATARRNKWNQRERITEQMRAAVAKAAAAVDERGRRGVPWTKMARSALLEALAAVDRYREVK
jgi:hypothetical protein